MSLYRRLHPEQIEQPVPDGAAGEPRTAFIGRVHETKGPVVPEWRRRALEQHDRLGFVAVTDLTERGAA